MESQILHTVWCYICGALTMKTTKPCPQRKVGCLWTTELICLVIRDKLFSHIGDFLVATPDHAIWIHKSLPTSRLLVALVCRGNRTHTTWNGTASLILFQPSQLRLTRKSPWSHSPHSWCCWVHALQWKGAALPLVSTCLPQYKTG